MHVLYVIDSLAPGGAERSLVDMAPYLLAAGVDLEVAVLHDRAGLAGELRGHGVPIYVVGGASRGAWFAGAVRLLRRRRPDLVHTTLFDSDIVGRAAAAILRIPTVSTLANTPYGPEHMAESGVSVVRLRGAQVADAATSRLVRRFHAVSRATADACIARLKIPADKIEVIPRGRDLTRMGEPSAARRATVRQSLGIPEETPLVVAVARQEPQKGLDVLIRATPDLLRHHPGAMVMVAGREGRSSRDLSQLTTEVGCTGNVRFLGARDDVADLLCAADVFVLPSRREGLPGAVLEAMAMRVPIVASDLPNVVEAVPGDDYAVLVPCDDPEALNASIVSVLDDPASAERRAVAARARFDEHFDIAAVSRAMVRFYRAALAAV